MDKKEFSQLEFRAVIDRMLKSDDWLQDEKDFIINYIEINNLFREHYHVTIWDNNEMLKEDFFNSYLNDDDLCLYNFLNDVARFQLFNMKRDGDIDFLNAEKSALIINRYFKKYKKEPQFDIWDMKYLTEKQ